MDSNGKVTICPPTRGKNVDECSYETEEATKRQLYMEKMFNSLTRKKAGGHHPDIAVQIGNKKIYIHRQILIDSSDYFKAMFSHNMKESLTNIIQFPETPPEVVIICIVFIYFGKAKFSTENPEAMIMTSEIMQLHNLTDMYFKFLVEHINISTCFYYLDLAEKFSNYEAKEAIVEFILRNSKDYTSLSPIDLKIMLKGLGRSTKCESLKWTAIINWIQYDFKERKQETKDLLHLVNLLCLPRTHIGFISAALFC